MFHSINSDLIWLIYLHLSFLLVPMAGIGIYEWQLGSFASEKLPRLGDATLVTAIPENSEVIELPHAA